MTTYEFAKNLFESAVESIEFYTVEDAAIDIKNAIADGWEIPDDMDADDLCRAMNSIIEEMAE